MCWALSTCPLVTSPNNLGGKSDGPHFREKDNVASEWQMENLNPEANGCLSADSRPRTGWAAMQRLQTSCSSQLELTPAGARLTL